LEAFDLFKKNIGSDMKLILSGHILWDDESVKNILNKLQFKKDIIFTGRVNDEDLKFLLGSAYCLSFVPTFEGFGLPIVEAFQSGVPVICSNTTSMPEVAGDATILVNPFDVSEIAKAMERINKNETLRSELINKGFVQKNKFTWKNTAEKLYDSMIKVINE
jgi:glycosyltransferase involved in cell wall biosynthesis